MQVTNSSIRDVIGASERVTYLIAGSAATG
jgi:hypothetical protein